MIIKLQNVNNEHICGQHNSSVVLIVYNLAIQYQFIAKDALLKASWGHLEGKYHLRAPTNIST